MVSQQTVSFVAQLHHAKIVGISDHFEYLSDGVFEEYEKEVRSHGLKLGTEINGHEWVTEAVNTGCDYYIFHCFDRDADYLALERLLATEKPVIIAHPNMLNTDLNRVAPQCLIEINNRYIWRCNWKSFYLPFKERFRFVMSSDAHQPHWLSQSVAQLVAAEIGIKETLLF